MDCIDGFEERRIASTLLARTRVMEAVHQRILERDWDGFEKGNLTNDVLVCVQEKFFRVSLIDRIPIIEEITKFIG